MFLDSTSLPEHVFEGDAADRPAVSRTSCCSTSWSITTIRNQVQIYMNIEDTHFVSSLILLFEGEGRASQLLQSALHN